MKPGDRLTIMLEIVDPEVCKKLWENHAFPESAQRDGYRVHMLHWGNPLRAREEVLTNIDRVVSGDRGFFNSELARLRLSQGFGDLSDLEGLIEAWDAEACEKYGG